MVGVDDGFFEKGWCCTFVVGARHCWVGSLLSPYGLGVSIISVDGEDGVEGVADAVRRAGGGDFVLLDTPVFAGFNVVDPELVRDELGAPVIAVYHYPPDRAAVKRALRRAFGELGWRWRVLVSVWERLEVFECRRGRLYAALYGVGRRDAWGLLCSLQLYTRTPEPLYTAGRVASALSRFYVVRLRGAAYNPLGQGSMTSRALGR